VAGSKLPDSITGRVSAAIVGLIEVNRKKLRSSDRLKEISSFIQILPIRKNELRRLIP
jgi:hypothetical protein